MRRVIRPGGSFVSTHPLSWAKARLNPGNKLALIANDESCIVLVAAEAGKPEGANGGGNGSGR